jgi:hypothetical protein
MRMTDEAPLDPRSVVYSISSRMNERGSLFRTRGDREHREHTARLVYDRVRGRPNVLMSGFFRQSCFSLSFSGIVPLLSMRTDYEKTPVP